MNEGDLRYFNLPKNVKREFDTAIKAIRERFHSFKDCFIGGGAVRDVIHRKPFKDIDIFTFDEIPEPWRMEEIHADEYVDGQQRILHVSVPIKVPKVRHPVQIIQLNPERATTARGAVSQFAFGLQQIWYSPEHKRRGKGNLKGIGYTSEFFRDAIDKKLTVTSCNSTREMVRILFKSSTLLDRYKDHTLVIPAGARAHGHDIDPDMSWRMPTEPRPLNF